MGLRKQAASNVLKKEKEETENADRDYKSDLGKVNTNPYR